MNILFKLSKAARDDHCGKRIFRETLWFLKFKFYWISAVTIFQNIIKTENIFYFFPPQIDNFYSLFMGEKNAFFSQYKCASKNHFEYKAFTSLLFRCIYIILSVPARRSYSRELYRSRFRSLYKSQVLKLISFATHFVR